MSCEYDKYNNFGIIKINLCKCSCNFNLICIYSAGALLKKLKNTNDSGTWKWTIRDKRSFHMIIINFDWCLSVGNVFCFMLMPKAYEFNLCKRLNSRCFTLVGMPVSIYSDFAWHKLFMWDVMLSAQYCNISNSCMNNTRISTFPQQKVLTEFNKKSWCDLYTICKE